MLDPVGFWSYARQDDAHSDGQLSQLRAIVGKAIVLQSGVEVVVWQDVAAIPYGADWAEAIERTIGQTTFFIPIVTPRYLKSENCRDEFLEFRRRMRDLGRTGLVFPVHYVSVDGMIADETVFGDGLATLRRSQWIDFRPLFYADPKSQEVRRWAGDLAASVLKALRQPAASQAPPAPEPPSRAVDDRAPERGLGAKSAQEPSAVAAPAPPPADDARRVADAAVAHVSSVFASPPPQSVRSDPRKLSAIAAAIALVCVLAAAIGTFAMRGAPRFAASPTPPTIVSDARTPTSPAAPARSGKCHGAVVPLNSLAARAPGALTAAEECALKRADLFRECADCPAMVVIPAGTFTMGSIGVRIARPFAIGEFTVTVAEFTAFVRATNYDAGSDCTVWNGKSWEPTSGRSWRDPGFPQTGSHPATCLNWYDGQAYAKWLAGRTGETYRLPSEAEWEYAARGQTDSGPHSLYFFGDSQADFCDYGNGMDQTARARIPGAGDWQALPCVDSYAYTSPVGSFKPNAFGLFDVAGNVSQWLEDCYHENYDEAPTDGSAWITGTCDFRVLRGGSWNSGPAGLSVDARFEISPWVRRSDTGFRLARTPAP